MSDAFDQFWASYPKRQGANPKHPARVKFERAVRQGVSASAIGGAARAYAAEQKKLRHEGTEYVAMAVTWLNQRRWEDYPDAPGESATPTAVWICNEDAKWSTLATEYRRIHGKNPPTVPGLGGQGWYFPMPLMGTGDARNANAAGEANQRQMRGERPNQGQSFLSRNEVESKIGRSSGDLFDRKQSPESVTHSTGGPNGAARAVFAKVDR